MQQHLPFTVLKPGDANAQYGIYVVATVPTVYGIETKILLKVINIYSLQQYLPFTVLKLPLSSSRRVHFRVATVPTVYGIETI